MKIYVVGGAVRDELLGLPVQDKDHVVVGATPEEMVAQGFKPVGKDFPVFLHPKTHEEYALARTERKSGRGYKGFVVYAAPEVTLEEDLRRRDLTINAMARAEDRTLIDPHNGKKDLEDGVLRHVSEAFAEDPVRILRVARFAARFGFKVAPETLKLMKAMAAAGETEFLVAERVWQEFAKGLAEKHPQKMFDVLRAAGLQAKWLPRFPRKLPALKGPVPVRFAALAWSLPEREVRAFCDQIRAPGEARDLALLAAGLRPSFLKAGTASAKALLELFKRADAFRRPERFALLLQAVRLAHPKVDYRRLGRALKAASAVDAGRIAAATPDKAEIPKRVDQARIAAIGKLR